MGFWWDQTSTDKATQVVEKVVAGINNRDFAALDGLITDDVSFTDSMGGRVAGREDAMLLLKQLLAYDPGFEIRLDDVTPHNDMVLATGYTMGHRQQTAERTLWRLRIRDGLLAEWRSYSADAPRPVVQMLMGTQTRART